VARIMSIDYGTKRIGVAVTDPLQIIANGLETIPTSEIFNFLKQYLDEEEVEKMVVGMPFHLDGKPTYVSPLIEDFIKKVNKLFPTLEVVTQDERFTSQDAKKIILQSGAKKKKRQDKSLVDKISAVLILQEYLESQRGGL
jgi:putative pre-16S rRNA nuclease